MVKRMESPAHHIAVRETRRGPPCPLPAKLRSSAGDAPLASSLQGDVRAPCSAEAVTMALSPSQMTAFKRQASGRLNKVP